MNRHIVKPVRAIARRLYRLSCWLAKRSSDFSATKAEVMLGPDPLAPDLSLIQNDDLWGELALRSDGGAVLLCIRGGKAAIYSKLECECPGCVMSIMRRALVIREAKRDAERRGG